MAESKIIRHEEQRSKYHKVELAAHRRGIVRSEARSALLAYGFLRGRPYQLMEPKSYGPPDWNRVRQLVDKFGIKVSLSYNYITLPSDYPDFTKRQELKKQQLKDFDKWKTDGNHFPDITDEIV